MKILNLFAGIGGNRSAWGNKYEITSIEYNQHVALAYHKRFPNDIIIIDDAYKYFLNHFNEFDILWASPPCTTHTLLNVGNVGRKYKGKNICLPGLPDLRLYSLILFCQSFFRGYFIIENVIPYYKPLIKPTAQVGRHYIWANFHIKNKSSDIKEHYNSIKTCCKVKGVDYDWFLKQKFNGIKKRVVIHDCVNPKLSKYIFYYLNKNQKLKQYSLSLLEE